MNSALKIINIVHNNRIFWKNLKTISKKKQGKKANIFLSDQQSTSIFFDRAPAAQNEPCLKGRSSLQFTLCDKKISVNTL